MNTKILEMKPGGSVGLKQQLRNLLLKFGVQNGGLKQLTKLYDMTDELSRCLQNQNGSIIGCLFH